jgi:hypothetical protein
LLVGMSVVVSFIAGCPPNPIPTPSPSPTPPLIPIRIEGGRLVPLVVGTLMCCEGYPQNGWPLVATPYLDLMSSKRVNLVEVRTGPFTREGEPGEITIMRDGKAVKVSRTAALRSRLFERYRFVSVDERGVVSDQRSKMESYIAASQNKFEGFAFDEATGKYDLLRFNDLFVTTLRSTIEQARSRGIYVGIDLNDNWPWRHDLSPFNARNNNQGFDLVREDWERPVTGFQEIWTKHVVRQTCRFDNVAYYQTGNESGIVSRAEWESSVYAAVKDELGQQGCRNIPVASNSDWAGADISAIHGYYIPVPQPRPVIVNETDNRETTPVEHALRAKISLERGGIYFYGWRGPMQQQPYEELLGYLGEVRAGTFNPPGYPPPLYGCPPLTGIRVTVHNVFTCQGNRACYVLDSTPLPPGGPEGSEARERCESLRIDGAERGPRWGIVSGTAEDTASNPNPYLFTVINPVGTVVVEACSWQNTICGRVEIVR